MLQGEPKRWPWRNEEEMKRLAGKGTGEEIEDRHRRERMIGDVRPYNREKSVRKECS